MNMQAVFVPDLLSRIALFRGLSPEHLSALEGLLHRQRFLAGTTIMTVEQMGEVVYIIKARAQLAQLGRGAAPRSLHGKRSKRRPGGSTPDRRPPCPRRWRRSRSVRGSCCFNSGDCLSPPGRAANPPPGRDTVFHFGLRGG